MLYCLQITRYTNHDLFLFTPSLAVASRRLAGRESERGESSHIIFCSCLMLAGLRSASITHRSCLLLLEPYSHLPSMRVSLKRNAAWHHVHRRLMCWRWIALGYL